MRKMLFDIVVQEVFVVLVVALEQVDDLDDRLKHNILDLGRLRVCHYLKQLVQDLVVEYYELVCVPVELQLVDDLLVLGRTGRLL